MWWRCLGLHRTKVFVSHRNARLTVPGRRLLIQRLLSGRGAAGERRVSRKRKDRAALSQVRYRMGVGFPTTRVGFPARRVVFPTRCGAGSERRPGRGALAGGAEAPHTCLSTTLPAAAHIRIPQVLAKGPCKA
ncbi:hypothetical protein B1H19_30080 [Streptomyces gilvosporeus]|uniref:Uncharacterized protein n=1 Tax=Streptomyces gilvosporeus TaxID=553510 RepID=A0A1V0TYL4_9ACTN|nr:hypothetical protein B1H19_30080 [Streptomyces gilvosporeus]